MNWDAIGSIGEVVGAFGVIISLIYLASQIRHNSAWLKSSVVESAGTRAGDLSSSVYSDEELSRIIRIGLSKDADSLNLEEKHRFTLVLYRTLRNQEINYTHYKSGLLGEESLEGFLQNLTIWMSSPLFDEWWESLSPVFGKEFRLKVEGLRKTEASLNYELYNN